jgi:hypothetical protein
VRKFKRIYYDGVSWNFSKYFEYLGDVADDMPHSLRDFAGAVESYILNGSQTLHDSRILSFNVSKIYGVNFSPGETVIEVRLVDQFFEGRVVLRYEKVSSFDFSEPNLMGDKPADVLLHEFSIVADGVYSHHIVFDHGGEFYVEFGCFSRELVEI